MELPPGTTSFSLDVTIVDDTGLPVTGLVASTFPTVKYSRGSGGDSTISLSDLSTVSSAYSSGGIKERGEGVYRLDVPDAAIASAGVVRIRGEASGKRLICPTLDVRYVEAKGPSQATLSTYAGGDTSGTTTLLSRVTAARAGYWDNLNVGSVLATQADVLAINQSASRRIVLTTVAQYERPETGTVNYTVEARTYDGDGAATNATTTPTLTAIGIITGSLTGHLSAATNPATGVYRWTYELDAADATEQLQLNISAAMSDGTFTLSAYTQVTDFVAATFTTADRANLTALVGDVSGLVTAAESIYSETFNIYELLNSGNLNVADVLGKVLGGGSSTILGSGVRAFRDDGTTIPTASTIATTTRDVSNASPASGSLGEKLNTATTNSTTILSRLGAFTGSGVNTVLGFFKALFRKDASTPSDIGGTFDPSTDSQEAQVDNGAAVNLTPQNTTDIAQGVADRIGEQGLPLEADTQAQIDAIQARTDLITAASITINTPVDVTDDNRLNLIEGDSHESGSQLPTWTITGYSGPALSAAGKLRLLPLSDYKTLGTAAAAELEVSTIVSQVSTTVTVTAAITAAQSAALTTFPPAGRDTHQYQLVGITTSGAKNVTLRLAKATVSRRVEPAA
jgi:hypothetical protein